MTECRRFICGDETDGDLYCSERCERMAAIDKRRQTGGQAGAQREDTNRHHVIANDRNA